MIHHPGNKLSTFNKLFLFYSRATVSLIIAQCSLYLNFISPMYFNATVTHWKNLWLSQYLYLAKNFNNVKWEIIYFLLALEVMWITIFVCPEGHFHGTSALYSSLIRNNFQTSQWNIFYEFSRLWCYYNAKGKRFPWSLVNILVIKLIFWTIFWH